MATNNEMAAGHRCSQPTTAELMAQGDAVVAESKLLRAELQEALRTKRALIDQTAKIKAGWRAFLSTI